MLNRKYKSGFSILEVLVSISLFGIAIISSYYMVSKILVNEKNNNYIVEETLFIKNTYLLFSADPIRFKENISVAYGVSWIEDSCEKNNIVLKYYENDIYICVYIIKEGENIEEWVRKKVIQ